MLLSVFIANGGSLLRGGSRDGSKLLLPQCAASMDRLSSIGVNILCLAAEDIGLGCGMGGL
jgi:hypothetical protein